MPRPWQKRHVGLHRGKTSIRLARLHCAAALVASARTASSGPLRPSTLSAEALQAVDVPAATIPCPQNKVGRERGREGEKERQRETESRGLVRDEYRYKLHEARIALAGESTRQRTRLPWWQPAKLAGPQYWSAPQHMSRPRAIPRSAVSATQTQWPRLCAASSTAAKSSACCHHAHRGCWLHARLIALASSVTTPAHRLLQWLRAC